MRHLLPRSAALRRLTGQLLSIGVMGLACFTSGCIHDGPADLPGKIVMTVATDDGRFESAEPQGLTVIVGPGASAYSLAVFGAHDGETWAMRAGLSAEQASSGKATLPLGEGPNEQGHAVVQRFSAIGKSHVGLSGQLEASFGKDGLSGRIVGASPGDLDATFSGQFRIQCMVTRAELEAAGGKGPQGSIQSSKSSDGTEALVADEKFVTPACQPFGALVR